MQCAKPKGGCGGLSNKGGCGKPEQAGKRWQDCRRGV